MNDNITNLPVYPFLDEICSELKNSSNRVLIITAETAAGKSTGIPLALMEKFEKKILMLEPRRLAVLNVANRVAENIGEKIGSRVGYQIFMENVQNEHTKLSVMTQGIFTRKIQNDPELSDIGVVIFDEFHERSVDLDLNLALLKESMELRDDLYVIIMSATINCKKVSDYFGGAKILEIPGRQFPVKKIYKGRVEVSAVLRDLVSAGLEKNVLVFLPGLREINSVYDEIESFCLDENVELLKLHSSISWEQQKNVLNPVKNSKKRIILSSAIAETSITVPDIGIVIDCGLSRYNSYNRDSGMETLITRKESYFSAEQRAGRAGRVSNGTCYRLWSEAERLELENVPEIQRCDLMKLVLECSSWGVQNSVTMDWLDSPTEKALKKAKDVLELLGCIDSEGKITKLGRICLGLGVDVRLAVLLVYGVFHRNLSKMLNFVEKLEEFGKELKNNQNMRFELERRVQKSVTKIDFSTDDIKFSTDYVQNSGEFSTGIALLNGFPDRLAKLTEDGRYQLYSGKMGTVYNQQAVENYIVVTGFVDKGETGLITEWTKIDDSFANAYMNFYSHEEFRIVPKSENSLVKFREKRYGQIMLMASCSNADIDDYKDYLKQTVQKSGIDFLLITDGISNYFTRIHFALKYGMSDKRIMDWSQKMETIAEDLDQWLLPFINSQKDFNEKTILKSLEWYFDVKILDELVPEYIRLSLKGKPIRIVYQKQDEKIIPVIEIIIQRAFGCYVSPKILGQKVLFKFLSPAQRPLQTTDDLENFWKNTWPEICSEMKGRYPKHNWDYRIAED